LPVGHLFCEDIDWRDHYGAPKALVESVVERNLILNPSFFQEYFWHEATGIKKKPPAIQAGG